MNFYRRALSICATLLVAFAAGHLVQNADVYFGTSSTDVESSNHTDEVFRPTPRFKFDKVTPMATQQEAARPGDDRPTRREVKIPSAPDAAFRAPRFSTETRALAKRMEGLDDDFRLPGPEGRDLNQFGMPCESSLSAKPAPGGMIELALRATCRPDTPVEISQDQLHFTARTSNTGVLKITLPALDTSPVILALFPDDTLLTAVAQVPEAAQYRRVALQWRKGQGMHLHAYEFGAAYDGPGHVWAEAPRNPQAGADGKGGFLTALGATDMADARLAEVYSFPRGVSRDRGVVRVSVEVEVTGQNCGHEIAGETLQRDPEGDWQIADLVLPVPDCDAVGQFLVLKNVLRDMKIARN